MQWQAAIGLSNKQPALRDQVDAALARIEPRIRELSAKYAVATGPALKLTGAAPIRVAANEAASAPAQGGAESGDAAVGKEIFNSTCAHCHGPNAVVADRKINLRGLKHKYGDQMSEVFFTTVNQGRPAKGMPAWKDVFKHQDLVNILAYLNTLQEK
jgi:polar amino acid transport system substrate-binding protein